MWQCRQFRESYRLEESILICYSKLQGGIFIMKYVKIIVFFIIIFFLIFSSTFLFGIHIAYTKVFSRADYNEYDNTKYLTYDEIDKEIYSREVIQISSGENVLSGYLYGTANNKGLIIVSPGHRDANDVKLYEVMYFVDQGWQVLSYDYTGCYNSEGESMISYMQAPTDLDAVLDYVEMDERFSDMPIMLFGHSLGAYASTAVLQEKHNITAVVAASGFDDPKEQWKYSVRRYTGIMGPILAPYAEMYMSFRFSEDAHYSAIDGINATDIPIFIISGTEDEFYGGMSKLYERQDEITNSNCIFLLMEEENHSGHYDYFLTAESIEYREQVDASNIKEVDKKLYMEHDLELMDIINQFYTNTIQ